MNFKEEHLRGNKESAVGSSEILIKDIVAFKEDMERLIQQLPTQVIVPTCISQQEIEGVLQSKVYLATEGLGWNHWRVIE